MIFNEMREDLNELVALVRQSVSYCTMVAANPNLATDTTHAKEVLRERRIVELSERYGITS